MDIKEELLQGYKNGTIWETIKIACERSDVEKLAEEFIEIHNDKIIDIVELFKTLKNYGEGSSFFKIRSIFEKALPNLDASILAVMQCVIHLYRESGNDYMAGTIIIVFVEFCKRKKNRPVKALNIIKKSPRRYAILLPATLIAGSSIDIDLFLEQAMDLCVSKSIELKRKAVFALGRFDLEKFKEKTSQVVELLEKMVEKENDDEILGCIVKSASNVLRQHKSFEPRVMPLISKALTKGDGLSLHAASEILLESEYISNSLQDIMLEKMVLVKGENKATLELIDSLLSQMISSGKQEKVIRFLEGTLVGTSDKTIEDFKMTADAIYKNKRFFEKVYTRWFLQESIELCDFVRRILEVHHSNGKKRRFLLEVDVDELNSCNAVQILLVARKTVGFLFLHPVAATSALLSLMKHAPEEWVVDEIAKILFSTLFLNFSKSTKEYLLERIAKESGYSKETIERILSWIDTYLGDLESVGNLVALHPSVSQREAYSRHAASETQESMKQAMEKSIFWNLVPHQVLLYGRKAINYVENPEGQQNRMEIPLKSLEVDIEFPRMKYFDPVGLDYQLSIFRVGCLEK